MKIHDLLKKIREDHDYTFDAMANRLNLSHTLINQIENGKKNITEKYIDIVCKAFPLYEKKLRESFFLY